MQAQAQLHRYTGITTTGVQKQRLYAPAGSVFNKYALQVKGTGAAATTWSVTLEGSLDDTNWTVLATHSSTDGSTVFVVDKPCTSVRVNVGSLTLGSATDIAVDAVASA